MVDKPDDKKKTSNGDSKDAVETVIALSKEGKKTKWEGKTGAAQRRISSWAAKEKKKP